MNRLAAAFDVVRETAWHSARLLALRHNGDDLPDTRAYAVGVAGAVEVLRVLTIPLGGGSSLFSVWLSLTVTAALLLLGLQRWAIIFSLLDLSRIFLRCVWVGLFGAETHQLLWIATLNAFATVYALLTIRR